MGMKREHSARSPLGYSINSLFFHVVEYPSQLPEF